MVYQWGIGILFFKENKEKLNELNKKFGLEKKKII